jgi:acetyl-CoA synthetase
VVCGRNDDVIKASGYRIGPFEIESVLMEHPAVLECAVTGAPDPFAALWSSHRHPHEAYLPSTRLGTSCRNLSTPDGSYKYPRILEFAPELPKTISGKIRRQ